MKISNINVKQKQKQYQNDKHNQTYKYDDKLQDFVNDYNNRPHRSLSEKAPGEVTKSERRHNMEAPLHWYFKA